MSEVDHVVKVIVGALTTMRAEGTPLLTQLAYAKDKLFDEEFVDPANRQSVLKQLNRFFGTNWSMNQVKRATTAHVQLIEVDELHGAVVIPAGGPVEASYNKSDDEPVVVEPAQVVIEPVVPVAPAVDAPKAAPAATETVAPKTSSSQKENTMNTNTNVATVEEFVAFLAATGRTTPELRFQAFEAFLETQLEAKSGYLVFQSKVATLSVDEKIFHFCDGNEALAKGFIAWVLTNPVAAQVEEGSASSRYSLMGDRDEGIRSSWIAAGAALIGGGLEMTVRGGLSFGSAVGTTVGAVGSFFAGELLEDKIDHTYGRYVAAGLLGMTLGGLGSAVGRGLITGNPMRSIGNASSAQDALPAPVATVNSPEGISSYLTGL